MSEPAQAAVDRAKIEVPQTLRELLASRLDWVSRYGLFVTALTMAATTIGVALSPYLLAAHPILLLVLAPIPRHVVLVAGSLDLPTTLVVTGARQLFGTSAAVCLGLRFGEAGITWAEQQSDGLRRGAQLLRKGFRHGGLLVVFVAPFSFVAATATAIGASAWRVLAISSAGQLVWIWIWHSFGDFASQWIAPITAFFQRYTWQSTAACALVVAAYYARRYVRRQAR